MALGTLSVASLILASALAFYLRSVHGWYTRTQVRPLPPGPQRLPYIGNLFNGPSTWKPWLRFRDLTDRYGDIVYLDVLGKPMLILGSPSVIFEFLDKRSAVTSDRVQTPFIALASQEYNFGFMPYGEQWRRHRRIMWQHFHSDAARNYWPIQRSATHDFLSKLLESPADCQKLIRYYFAASALTTVYGTKVVDPQDVRIEMIEGVLLGLRECTIAVQFLLDRLPILQYLPFWTPWIGKLLKTLASSEGPSRYMTENVFDEAQAQITVDHVDSSMLSYMLERMAESGAGEMSGEELKVARNVTATAAEAGADTTYSTTEGFFLAMCLFPEVQRKAREELDAVVGSHRLPDFSDRPSLVYIEAIIKESLRWHNVGPLGVAHKTMTDDELCGYFIPAGTTAVPNVWACLHDPDIYPEPDMFYPERFIKDGKLNPDILDPATLAFGFGRRICPGRYYADAGLFILIACVLHVFEIVPPLEEHDRPVKLQYVPSHGLISYPENFGCVVKPRSTEAAELIRSLCPEKMSEM